MAATKRLSASNAGSIASAVSLLKEGALVALPTETVYGLAADAGNEQAVRAIFEAKGRPSDHPLIVHIASFEELGTWAKDIPPVAAVLAKAFWPGPLTLLLQKAEGVSKVVTGGLSTIALRVPEHPVMLEVLRALKGGLAAPSANLHKRVSPTTAMHVMSGLSGKIAAVLDAGPCALGVESTIVDVTGPFVKILRPGPITQEMLKACLGVPVELAINPVTKVAGNMQVHYQPYTALKLMTLPEIKAFLCNVENKAKSFVVMHYSPFTTEQTFVLPRKMPQDPKAYEACLYATLHAVDALKVQAMLIERLPEGPEWSALWDRLSKAAAVC